MGEYGQQTPPSYSFATLGIHGDDAVYDHGNDVAPSMHVSTTYRYPGDPEKLIPEDQLPEVEPGTGPPGDKFVYSRYAGPNSSRMEVMLSQMMGGPCLTYSSGLSAFHALLVYLHPKVVAIGAGYHGCHGVLQVYQKLTGCKIVDLFDESSWDNANLGKGDIIHVESPINPTGRAFNVKHFADLAHKRGAWLTIDATFGPPPLQNPFNQDADFIMHSGTKYIGGHSDMLCGVVAINKKIDKWQDHYYGMVNERNFLGAVLGNMEGWLGIRSLRTMELRVKRQSENCEKIVSFLHNCLNGSEKGENAEAVKKVVAKLEHASLQTEDMGWLKQQMPGGFGPVFSLWCHNKEQAKRLPSKLHLFHHATSLGGVESLIEWRRMSDSGVEETLCRLSIGAEDWQDLKADLVQGCNALADEGR